MHAVLYNMLADKHSIFFTCVIHAAQITESPKRSTNIFWPEKIVNGDIDFLVKIIYEISLRK